MKALLAGILLVGVLGAFALCSGIGPGAGATADAVTSSDGFTAVAGTDTVVMDRRAKNDIALLSALILAATALLMVSALRHIKSKVPSEKSD